MTKASTRPPRQALRIVIALVCTGIALALLVGQIRRSPHALEAWSSLRPFDLIAPVAWMSVAVGLSALKWSRLLRALELELPYLRSLRALLAAWPFAAVTPSRAGDFVRSWMIRDRLSLGKGHASVLFDRLLDVQSLVMLSTIGAVRLGWTGLTLFFVSGSMLAWALAIILARRSAHWTNTLDPSVPTNSTWRNSWMGFLSALRDILSRPSLLAQSALISFITWLSVQCVFYTLCRAFHLDITWEESLTLWPFATLIGLIPITLAGMGTRDIAFIAIISIARGEITGFNALREQGIAQLHEDSQLLLATLAYTAVSSWLFALLGLPIALRDVLKPRVEARLGTKLTSSSRPR